MRPGENGVMNKIKRGVWVCTAVLHFLQIRLDMNVCVLNPQQSFDVKCLTITMLSNNSARKVLVMVSFFPCVPFWHCIATFTYVRAHLASQLGV